MWKLLIGVVVGTILGPQIRKAFQPVLHEAAKASAKAGTQAQRLSAGIREDLSDRMAEAAEARSNELPN
jgi:hypothetical protein